MNYEEKYKEMKKRVLAIGQGYVKEVDYSSPRSIAEYIDPDLKESEDERIRKAIVEFFECQDDNTTYSFVPKQSILAWLEKQGSKVDVLDDFPTEFERQISHLIASSINKEWEYKKDFVKHTANSLLQYAKNELEKQGEQKSWSEEDELMIQDAIHWINEFQKSNRCKDENDIQNSVTCENWLKSLKNRVQPQPTSEWSEEDEEMYKEVLTDIIYAKNDLKTKGCLGLSKRAMKAFNWFSKRHKSLSKGAEWQKQQMKETLQTEYEKGRFDMREEMMKDAVELHIVKSFNPVGTETEKPHGFTALCYNTKYPDFYPVTEQTIKVIPIKGNNNE